MINKEIMSIGCKKLLHPPSFSGGRLRKASEPVELDPATEVRELGFTVRICLNQRQMFHLKICLAQHADIMEAITSSFKYKACPGTLGWRTQNISPFYPMEISLIATVAGADGNCSS